MRVLARHIAIERGKRRQHPQHVMKRLPGVVSAMASTLVG
jgi:hypothetical protein